MTFPSKDDETIQWGSFTFKQQFYEHPEGITFMLVRLEHGSGMDREAPRREGVLITSNSVKILILSTSALEFYWDDADEHRALKYAHLDFEVFDMRGASSWTGLLPKVWGIVPGAQKPDLLVDDASGRAEPHSKQRTSLESARTLQMEILAHMDVHHSTNASAGNAITREILRNLLPQGIEGGEGEQDSTVAGVCGSSQCSRGVDVKV